MRTCRAFAYDAFFTFVVIFLPSYGLIDVSFNLTYNNKYVYAYFASHSKIHLGNQSDKGILTNRVKLKKLFKKIILKLPGIRDFWSANKISRYFHLTTST